MASVQRSSMAGRLTERLVKLELYHVANEIPESAEHKNRHITSIGNDDFLHCTNVRCYQVCQCPAILGE